MVHLKRKTERRFAALGQFEPALETAEWNHAKISGDKKKCFQILACRSVLCTVLNNKQLLSALTGCVWVMALLNPTLNHMMEGGNVREGCGESETEGH